MITPQQNEAAMNLLESLYFDNCYSEREWMNLQTLKEKTKALIEVDQFLLDMERANRNMASRTRRASIFNKMVALWGGRK